MSVSRQFFRQICENKELFMEKNRRLGDLKTSLKIFQYLESSSR